MQKQLSVSFSALHETVQSLSRATSNIEAILATLDGESALLGAGWSGQASDAFDEAKRSWALEMHALATLLEQAGTALNAATDRYAAAESTNSALWPV